MSELTDPREASGPGFAGPGGPHDRDSIVVDSNRAVLLDSIDVATMGVTDTGGETGQAIAMMLGGRINFSKDRAQILFIMDVDGVAGIVTELIALLGRAGALNADELLTELIARVDKLRADGHLSEKED